MMLLSINVIEGISLRTLRFSQRLEALTSEDKYSSDIFCINTPYILTPDTIRILGLVIHTKCVKCFSRVE